jgi:hypothetical protein
MCSSGRPLAAPPVTRGSGVEMDAQGTCIHLAAKCARPACDALPPGWSPPSGSYAAPPRLRLAAPGPRRCNGRTHQRATTGAPAALLDWARRHQAPIIPQAGVGCKASSRHGLEGAATEVGDGRVSDAVLAGQRAATPCGCVFVMAHSALTGSGPVAPFLFLKRNSPPIRCRPDVKADPNTCTPRYINDTPFTRGSPK